MFRIKPHFLPIYLFCLCIVSSLFSSCASNFARGQQKLRQGQFSKALQYFTKVDTSKYTPAHFNFYLAEAYRKSGQTAPAALCYQKAFKNLKTDEAPKNKSKNDKAHFYYALCLKLQRKYTKAQQEFAQYVQTGKDATLKHKAQLEVKNLGQIDKMLEQQKYYQVNVYKGKSLEQITFAPDRSFMIFAKNKQLKKSKETLSLFIVHRQGDGSWDKAQLLEISSDKYWDACPAISPDGKRLYFSSNRSGGYGGKDIWVANLTSSGKADNVRNLGPKINTRQDETHPYVSLDSKLYFASNGHWGLGGVDLLVASRSRGKIIVKNLGMPINSPADDFGLVYNADSTGYFSSNRHEKTRTYSFADKRPQKQIDYFLTIQVLTPDSSQTRDVPVPNAKVEVYEGTIGNKKLLHTFTADAQGQVKEFRVKPNRNYVIKASHPTQKTKYFSQEATYSTIGKQPDENADITKVHLNTKAYLYLPRNVCNGAGLLFVTHKSNFWIFDGDAKKELDKKVILFLKDNPNAVLEVGAHTDARGSAPYNLILSQKRAQTIADYIISKGINPKQLKVKGYGETELVIPDAKTEEEHQANRRTTFYVVELLED